MVKLTMTLWKLEKYNIEVIANNIDEATNKANDRIKYALILEDFTEYSYFFTEYNYTEACNQPTKG